MTEIDLWLIRHGSTKSNAEHRYLGKTDEGIWEKGEEDIRKKKYEKPDFLFTSPMSRCRQTAYLLFPDMEPVIIPEWTEIDFGLMELKNHYELIGDPAYQAWIDSRGALPYPGGESREEFTARSLAGFYRMLSIVRDMVPDNVVPRIVCVVHGGTIMALFSTLFGGDYFEYQVKCGEGFECRLKTKDDGIKEILEIKNI